MASAIYIGLLMLTVATSGRAPDNYLVKRQIVVHVICFAVYDILTLLK